MRLLLLGLVMLSFGVSAQEEANPFKNVREGKSFYSKNSQERKAKRALKKINKDEIIKIYSTAIKNNKKLCSYDINADMRKELEARNIDLDLEGMIYVLRDENEIDDVAAKILLSANEVKTTELYEKDEDNIFFPSDSDKTQAQLKLIASFEKNYLKNNCFDDAYKSYYQEFLKADKKFKSFELEALNLMALRGNLITEPVYIALEQARMNEVEMTRLSLSAYQQKLKTLRMQYPLRDINEKSDFVGNKVKKMKSSRRQKLFEQYTDLQIIMMGNVIKRLRQRLEYDAVDIQGFKGGVLQETIPLEPMERFRFAIRALRKEMTMLATNTYFKGIGPDYMDLMVASYEIGIIPAKELETVASLEEIWNPKKTFWEKAGVWVKTFSTVATILIPPPYGFIPALVVVVIEATAGKSKDPNQIDPSSMF